MASIPSSLRPWLIDPRSLTRRIRKACPDGFEVELLGQGWACPLREETRILELRPRRLALVREVRLVCDGRPWVCARTVVPPLTMERALGRLRKLGTRPLGALLFGARGFRRAAVDVRPLDLREATHARYACMLDPASRESEARGAWLRRSLFVRNASPLLVNEIFLAGFGAERLRAEPPAELPCMARAS